MRYFDHEKLDVYKTTLDFVIYIDQTIESFPKGKGYLIDQLQRAASSILLNIAEGSGEFSINEKVRFYRIAKRSATECAGIIDICHHLNLLENVAYQKCRELLLRIVSMLVKMAQISSSSPMLNEESLCVELDESLI
jgi:four helix bundle protein